MSAWSVLLVPLSIAFVVGVLFANSWIEQRVLSTPALIRYSARSRRLGPDEVEMFVAAESARVLGSARLR